jgi:hypothetical protein
MNTRCKAARYLQANKTNFVALVRKRTIPDRPTERPPVVGEVSANFFRIEGVAWSTQRIPMAVNVGFLDRMIIIKAIKIFRVQIKLIIIISIIITIIITTSAFVSHYPESVNSCSHLNQFL